MKDFGQWFKEQSAPVEELPEGICEGDNGIYLACCCGCDQWKELPVGVDEIPFTGYRHYCGGSPWCCP
jgi:hypothetical protein